MMMPLADYSRGQELRNYLRATVPFLVAGLILIIGGFFGGIWFATRHSVPESSQTAQAIEDLSDSLRTIQSLSDSIHRVDSLAMIAVLAQRPKTRAAMAPISVHDTLVIVEREAATDSSVATADTFANVRLAEGFRQMKTQLFVDSIALDSARFDLRSEVARHQKDLVQQRDSLQNEHAAELTREKKSEYRRGVRTGAKVVAGGAVIIGGAIKLVKMFTG